MSTIKEIREISGLSKQDFAGKYAIPLRTLQDWESEKHKCPKYMVNLLERAVKEDADIELKCYDPDFLHELGYCYQELLYCMNERGKDPYSNTDIFPLKYFTMILPRAMSCHIPNWLNERIGRLMNCVTEEDYTTLMEKACPSNVRYHFILGMNESEVNHSTRHK